MGFGVWVALFMAFRLPGACFDWEGYIKKRRPSVGGMACMAKRVRRTGVGVWGRRPVEAGRAAGGGAICAGA